MSHAKLPLAGILVIAAVSCGFQAASAAMLCPGVPQPPTGADAGPAFRQCIANTPAGGTLEIPAGEYTLISQVKITKSMTLRTAGTAGSTQSCEALGAACAILKPGRDLTAEGGFLVVEGTSGVTLDHLILDGDRWNRLASSAAQSCAGGYNRYGFNARMTNCASCRFTYNVSKNALCGTGLEFSGNDAVIVGNVFRGNGYNSSSQPKLWADGLTVIFSNRGRITDNLLADNSDIGLIVGGGNNATVARNTISQTRQLAFAGLMLFNFGGNRGSFIGAQVTDNVIDCGTSFYCHFGMMLGPHPWDTASRIQGGTVTGNRVTGARLGINVEGAGNATYPLVLYGNTATGSPTSAQFLCGTRQTANLNINTADSVVDRRGDTTPAMNQEWHNCP